jgi:hypothetical protein
MTRQLITAVRVGGWIFTSGSEYEYYEHTEFNDEHIFRYGLHIAKLESISLTTKSKIIRHACDWLNQYTIANELYTR